jgi:GrpB-like predicted nucleotidyltransferase (UPF0157 family)
MSEVRILEYQVVWPSQYAQVELELLSAIASPGVVLEHVGSTAVPGLCAKPVLDVVLGVSALSEMAMNLPALAQIGFTYRPEYELQIPDRRYFVRGAGRSLRVHLHSVVLGSALWLKHLAFRDALRADRQLMQSYAALKRHLALKHATDKAAYTEAKAPFIQQVLALQTQNSADASKRAAQGCSLAR